MTKSRRIAFLGPKGTYSEQACMAFDPNAIRLPYPSIPAAATAVDSGQADEAIVPIENSLEGAVTFTLDLLVHQSDLKIKGELVVPIECCLLVDGDIKLEDIQKELFDDLQQIGKTVDNRKVRIDHLELREGIYVLVKNPMVVGSSESTTGVTKTGTPGNAGANTTMVPDFTLVPSAQLGLTTLFEMGRGGHQCYSHHKILNSLN